MTAARGGQRSNGSGRSGRRRAILPALCGAALVLVAGCGSSSGSGAAASTATSAAGSSSSASGSTAASSGPAAAQAVIHIKNFGYEVPSSVSPGATVSVMNMDGEAHTVTADEGGAFDAQVTGDASGSFTAPTTPGTYAFHCTYHSNMHGMLVVQ
jgi:plastocyanin